MGEGGGRKRLLSFALAHRRIRMRIRVANPVHRLARAPTEKGDPRSFRPASRSWDAMNPPAHPAVVSARCARRLVDLSSHTRNVVEDSARTGMGASPQRPP